jgi:uncharacterized membrane protein
VVSLTLAALAGGGLMLLLAAPLLPAPASALIYAAASLVCHQRPERSFHLDAFQLPVCARCVGIYAGAALGAAVAVFVGRPRPSSLRPDSWRIRILTLVALLPTIVTVALEWMGIWYPSNVVRSLAGAPAGFTVALVVTRGLATVHYGEWAPRRPAAPPNPPRSPT